MTWVRGKGGVQRWAGALPPDAGVKVPRVTYSTPRRPSRTGFCIDCRASVERRSARCRTCYVRLIESRRKPERQSPPSAIDDVMARLARQFEAQPTTLTATICGDCGCLLAPAERCPNCLVWALRDEERWSWRVARRASRHAIWTILDQRKAA